MGWTEERVKMLKQLWQDGLSASQIASKMGNVTRNAVIGKVHRMGLSGRGAPKTRTARSDRKTTPGMEAALAKSAYRKKPVIANAVAESPAMPDEKQQPMMISVASISDNMCKWPIGDPGQAGFAFCGHPRLAGTSYCQVHTEMAFQPIRGKQAAGPDRRKLAG